MMKNIEISFNPYGNTVVGNYSKYRALDLAIDRKQVPEPHGYTIKGTDADIVRLAEYVSLFGYCIRSIKGWRKACNLAGVEITKNV